MTRHRVLLNKKKNSLIISIKNITKKICFAIHLITYLKHSFTYTAYMACDVKNRIKQFKQKKKHLTKLESSIGPPKWYGEAALFSEGVRFELGEELFPSRRCHLVKSHSFGVLVEEIKVIGYLSSDAVHRSLTLIFPNY